MRERGYLRFADRYRHPIVYGEKDTTIRLPGEHGVSVGQGVNFVDSADDVFAVGGIRVITTARVQDAPRVLENMNARYPHDTPRSILRSLNSHYDVDVDVASAVDIIQFDVALTSLD